MLDLTGVFSDGLEVLLLYASVKVVDLSEDLFDVFSRLDFVEVVLVFFVLGLLMLVVTDVNSVLQLLDVLEPFFKRVLACTSA